MPHTYAEDVNRSIDALSTGNELVLEEKLILLSIATDYIIAVTKKLEDELAIWVW